MLARIIFQGPSAELQRSFGRLSIPVPIGTAFLPPFLFGVFLCVYKIDGHLTGR